MQVIVNLPFLLAGQARQGTAAETTDSRGD
jgi:hypothetical protein